MKAHVICSVRASKFMTVGVLGFAIQIAVLALLSAQGWPLAAATLMAVELAVLHNFLWHERWTWPKGTRRGRLERLLRFQVTNGLTSIVSNVLLTTTLAQAFHLKAAVASACAVVITSLANYVLADRFVFGRVTAHAPQRKAVVGTIAAWLLAAGVAHASPGRETNDAWRDYVFAVEASMPGREIPCVPGREPHGDTRGVPGGTIHRWRGCIVLAGQSVDELLGALKHPGTPPPQEGILESRVLARTPDTLRIYLKLERSAVLTVTYDTEHEVTFRRESIGVATSRSVATRIAEVDGRDRGFLWRLNSYWRYVQEGPSVRVELDSLSLSRSVPVLLRPVTSPVIASVARESVTRALEALRSYVRPLSGD